MKARTPTLGGHVSNWLLHAESFWTVHQLMYKIERSLSEGSSYLS